MTTLGFHDQIAAYLNETIRAQVLATDQAVAEAIRLGCGVKLHRWMDNAGAMYFQISPSADVPPWTIHEYDREP